MTEKYKQTALPIFEKDLTEILDYIAYKLENPIAAVQLLDEIDAAVRKRLLNPIAFENFIPNGTDTPHYRLGVKNYDIYYVVIDNEMELRRIVYKRRDIVSLL